MTTPLPRAEFPVTEKCAYLNHAATGVPPRATRDAIVAFAAAQSEGGVLGTSPYELRMPSLRERLASFIGAKARDVTFLRNTSEGANVLALGLDWRHGDEIVLCDNEFPANAVPWVALQGRGVNVRFIPTAQERMTPDTLLRSVSSRTRAVAVSWVSFGDGYRHDLPALAEIAHRAGAWFFVDGIQGLGAFPLDVVASGADAFYGGGQKWLLALQGIGFLYVCPRLQERLRVGMPGWRALADMWDFLNYDQPYANDASRFEGGTPNFIGALSLATSIEFLERYDREAVAAHILALTDRLADGLRRLGADVQSQRGAGLSSGIVSFSVPGRDPVEIGRALQRAGVVTTYRKSGVRVSPHGYNTAEEIDRLLEAVPSRP